MEKIKFLSLLLLLQSANIVLGQIGGRNSFEFLRLPVSARSTSLGGTTMATKDEDVTLAICNPASLTDTMRGNLSLNYNFHFAGINFGYAGAGIKLPFTNLSGHVSASFANYGEFIAADETGTKLGTFSGSESAFTIGASYPLAERIRVGMNLKLASTAIEQYNATGLLTDLGMMYTTNEGRTHVAATITNFGAELETLDGKKYGTPLDIQIGISNRLQYLPLRFSVIFHRLQRWGIRYDDPNFQDSETFLGEEQEESSSFSKNLDNLFRHAILSGEFSIGKSGGLKVRGAYNHLRRRELSLSQFRSLAGFSMGVGLKINRFRIDYGVGYHHLAGGTNHLSISTNLASFRSKL
jgi:hypothetical protein